MQAAVAAWGDSTPRFTAALAALTERPRASLQVAEPLLDSALAGLWARGWTPADLMHVVARQLSARHVELAAAKVVADGHGRAGRGQALHPRWREQLADLEQRARTREPPPDERVGLLVEVLCLLVRLAEVPRTVPPPGSGWCDASTEASLDARMLARVRALLAKAESTDFEEEAEAFTAKAQELIARHAIDEALLHTVANVGEPSVRRLLIDDPYADAKACLVAEVAAANRCRTVYSPQLAWVTAFGYDHDLDAVELLSASLLTQATGTMVRHGSRRDASGRSVTRSFRRAFLLGFAQRVGERLREATEDAVSANAEAGERLLPVLSAREERLRAAEQAAFPELVRRTSSVSNTTGWFAGKAAAELANLDVSPQRLPAS